MDVQGTQELTETNGRKQDAPFAQLPNELLIPIFIEASFEPSLVWRIIRTPGKRPREEGAWRYCNMEVVISHVCQQWRYVSLGVPALWTTFYYIDDCRSNPREILQRLDAYLERSGTQLLDIWIDLRAGRRNLVDRNQSLITKTIVHINRWRSFHFFPHYVPALLLTFLTQLKDLAAPNLETFCTSANYRRVEFALGLPMTGGSANTPSSSTIFKKGAPKLSVLSMDNSGFFVNLLPLLTPAYYIYFTRILQWGWCQPSRGCVPWIHWPT
ncbi:hypothetical protein BJ912DRAFT_896076 [Pholiota molesta]|nr:hypothetical protein BJ912DRAFT_896076 [Pholiota molesta]